jgi:hypothetical protein
VGEKDPTNKNVIYQLVIITMKNSNKSGTWAEMVKKAGLTTVVSTCGLSLRL